jgi:hypothetical protein
MHGPRLRCTRVLASAEKILVINSQPSPRSLRCLCKYLLRVIPHSGSSRFVFTSSLSFFFSICEHVQPSLHSAFFSVIFPRTRTGRWDGGYRVNLNQGCQHQPDPPISKGRPSPDPSSRVVTMMGLTRHQMLSFIVCRVRPLIMTTLKNRSLSRVGEPPLWPGVTLPLFTCITTCTVMSKQARH